MNKYFFLSLLISLSVLFACNHSENNDTCKNSEVYGTLSIGETGTINSLFPLSINNSLTNQIASLIHEGLVKYDVSSLKIIPGLADRWDVDSSETVYRFYLNTHAYFQNDKCFSGEKGRKVTAKDVLYSLTMLCSQIPENTAYSLFVDQIKGAKAFYGSKKTEGNIEGLVVENDSTFVIKLEKPNPMFLHFLANPTAAVFPKEAYDAYKTSMTVGIGPFEVVSFAEGEKPMILVRNPHYFKLDAKGNCLPYLDTVKIYFVGSLRAQLDMVKAGQLDVVMNIDNETLTSFLEENVKLFEGDKAVLKVIADPNMDETHRQHIIRSNMENFFLSDQGLFDLTEVKLKKDTL